MTLILVLVSLVALAAMVVLARAQIKINAPLSQPTATPRGIVDLELAWGRVRTNQVLAAWDAGTKGAAAKGVRWDFAFLAAYGTFLAAFGFLAAGLDAEHGSYRPWIVAGLAVLAAALDAVENYVMLGELKSGTAVGLSPLRWFAATIKFLLIGGASLFVVFALSSTATAWVRLLWTFGLFAGIVAYVAVASLRRPHGVSQPVWNARLSRLRLAVLGASVFFWCVNYGAGDIAGRGDGLLYPALLWTFEYAPLALIGVFLLLVVYNLVGSGLGLSRLFLAEHFWPRFWGGFGAAVVAGHLMAATYLIEPRLHLHRVGPPVVGGDEVYKRVAGHPRDFLKKAGIDGWYFDPDEKPEDLEFQRRQATPRVGRDNSDKSTREDFSWRWITFMCVTATPFWLTLLLPALPIRAFEGRRFQKGREDRSVFTEGSSRRFLSWTGGMLLGIGLMVGLIWLGIPLTFLIEKLLGMKTGRATSPTLVYGFAAGLFAANGVVVFFALRLFKGTPAGTAISAFLWLVASLYTFYAIPTTLDHLGGLEELETLGLLFRYWRFLAPVALLVWIGYSNGSWYKLTITGLDRDRGPDGKVRIIPLNQNFPASPVALDDAAVLKTWLEKVGDRKRLVILSVSGGASRSGIWVASVIDELRASVKTATFDDHVRLITGASGGMLGTATYVAELTRLIENPGAAVRPLYEPLDCDFLAPVARRLALYDTACIVDPKEQANDRGRVLDKTWEDFIPYGFGELKEHEEKAEIPSIVLSPMLVEDGRRLLISNLNLDDLTRAHGPSLGGQYAQGLSVNAVELNRLMPEAFPDFPLRTAVRLNASFPYVSPAVSLPTDPPRRPVDAGYYDNYGVNIACAWVLKHIEAIKAENVKVLLIQIRDHMSKDARFGFSGEASGASSIANGLSFLTAPLSGAGSARYSTNSFRNDGEIAALGAMFEGSGASFETVVFELPNNEVALNWHLTSNEIETIRDGVNDPANKKAFADVAAWF